MIVFVGCSYTWGSGLQYEYLYENGWSVDEINKVLPFNYHLEQLSYDADEYRKKHNWPNLVAKELNKPFVIGTYTNGGSNLTTTLPALDCLNHISRAYSITTIVVQFTSWVRDVEDDDNFKLKFPFNGSRKNLDSTQQDFMNEQILSQIKQIEKCCKDIQSHEDLEYGHMNNRDKFPSWFGLSWQEDLGCVLKEYYPENFIPIHFEGNTYNSFEPITPPGFNEYDSLDKPGLRICDTIPGVKDTHLNSKGCKVVAKSIIKKLKQY